MTKVTETHTVHFAGKNYSVTVDHYEGLVPHADSLVDAVVDFLNGRSKGIVRYSNINRPGTITRQSVRVEAR